MRLYVIAPFILAIFSLNAHAGSFTDMNIDFPSVYLSSVGFGDYDSDGDLDMILTGFSSTQGGMTRLYNNNGYFLFQETPTNLPDVYYGTIRWGDYNGDNDLDLLMLNYADNSVFRIYTNAGDGMFSDDFIQLPGYYYGYGAWGDYDNDGDQDIIEVGSATRLYRNDGDGMFTMIDHNMVNVDFGSVNWGDYDNDGDLDLLFSGQIDDDNPVSRIYRNDGDGVFVDIGAPLFDARAGEGVWGDYDNDGDLDILICGSDGRFVNSETRVYRNDGNDTFVDINADILGAGEGGSAAWGDFDNDGDLDFILGGAASYPGIVLYRNDGNDTFIRTDDEFVGSCCGSVNWADYDNDGDLDLMVAVLSANPARIYRNDTETENFVPSSPTGLSAETGQSSVILSWQPGSDDHTPTPGLTYNLRIGTSPGAADILSPMSDIETGYRMIPAMGNVDQDLSWTINGLSEGVYYWSVQSVDTGYLGSAFADEQSFEIGATSIDENKPKFASLPKAYPNPFNASTVIEFSTPIGTEIDLSVYDILGRRVTTLYSGSVDAGINRFTWNAGDQPSGIYFYRLTNGDGITTGQMTLLK